MRELICGLYIILYTWITAPQRYKNIKGSDEKKIKEGYAKNYKIIQGMARGILKISGANLHIQGKENLSQKEAAVYMGTHKSYMDIVIMIALVDAPLIFIAKSELKTLPFLSTWVKTVGGIYIDRDDIRQSFRVIVEAIEMLERGYSIAIFPEGTRSKGSELGDFKAGSFKLATKANVPIVPIAMGNTFKLLEEARRLRPAKIRVNVGQVIDVPNLSKEQKQTISGDTQKYIQELLNQA